jgi:hypothetical protein
MSLRAGVSKSDSWCPHGGLRNTMHLHRGNMFAFSIYPKYIFSYSEIGCILEERIGDMDAWKIIFKLGKI